MKKLKYKIEDSNLIFTIDDRIGAKNQTLSAGDLSRILREDCIETISFVSIRDVSCYQTKPDVLNLFVPAPNHEYLTGISWARTKDRYELDSISELIEKLPNFLDSKIPNELFDAVGEYDMYIGPSWIVIEWQLDGTEEQLNNYIIAKLSV